ncbi:hypothetical protein D9613_000858 [Agrocybe pediades]|uniref:Uncharacterized protein n=1 Tax=Agrocybe pediades TaxID=84607 RepID=A0A8H4R1Z9_9AGAR|nr:hypothetical protein D9613_000858 [Agrocybe pediades]
MPKLHLKRTPEEEAEHRRRKERRRERRKRRREDSTYHAGTSSKRHHGDESNTTRLGEPKWASSDEDDEEQFGPQPAASGSHGHKSQYGSIEEEIEDRLFREKLFEAMGDDEMLDSVEARLNDLAHVPDRWRSSATEKGSGMGRTHRYDDDDLLMHDPALMDDEEYTEWIRAGMYRKTHAQEYAEQQRRKAAKEARRAEEKARKAEAARLEKLAEEERKMRKLERQSRRMEYARNQYKSQWTALLASTSEGDPDGLNTRALQFRDIPWPVAAAYREPKTEKRRRTEDTATGLVTSQNHDIGLDDLTVEAISSFILPVVGVADVADDVARKKERKDKLRETFLRFHPDKFEGRFMKRFAESEREKVREAIGQVSRVLNTLME